MSETSLPPTAADAMSARRRWGSLAVLALAVLLLAIDGTVLYLAVPSLTAHLDPSATQILWIGDIYSIAIAGLLVVMGSLADRIGRKKLLLTGSAAFGAASLLAAFANSAELLIAARFLLGVAGATLMPSTLSLIRSIFPDPTERARAIAVWSAAAGGGAALGPLVGGFLLEHFWWGSVFLINVPVMVVLIVAGAVLLPESRDPEPGPFDLASAGLSMLAMVPLVWAVKHAVSHGLDLQFALAALLAVGAGTAFVRRQRRLAAPMIDVTLFKVPAFSGAVMANFVAIFALTGLLYFFSQYLQLVRGYRPLVAGLAELPATLASIAVVALVAPAVVRWGRGPAIGRGLVLSGVGLALVGLAASADHYVWLALALVPTGLGIGLAMTLSTDAVVSSVPERKAGAASAVSETAYELGVALGVAVLGSTVTALYRGGLDLPADLPAAQRAHAEDSLVGALDVFGTGSAGGQHALEAFTQAMQSTAGIAAVVTLGAAVIAWRLIPADRGEAPTH